MSGQFYIMFGNRALWIEGRRMRPVADKSLASLYSSEAEAWTEAGRCHLEPSLTAVRSLNDELEPTEANAS